MNFTKPISLSLSLLSLVGLCSCSDEMQPESSQRLVRTISANAGGEGLMSRSAIDPTQYAEGAVGILWTPEDAIGVFSASESNVEFRNEATKALGRTTFKGEMADEPLYAYYPYSAANTGLGADNLRGTLPLTQSYNPATGLVQGDWKYGVPRKGAADEFDFVHVFALFKISVNASGTQMADETLRKVTLTLPQERTLGGEFTFSAVTGAYSMAHTEGSNVLTLEWGGTGTLSNGSTQTGYVSCAPDIKADDEIRFDIVTDKRTASFTAHAAYDFTGGTIYDFRLVLSELAGKFDVVYEELPPEPVEETANCYMITSAGEHDFKATVIGNGPQGIIPGAGFHTEDAYINPVSAKLLWEDTKGFVTDVTLREGRVHYTTSGNTGNAVIAVYDGYDGTGNVLWSWHIWGVGPELPGEYEIATKGGAKFTVMDRSLGSVPCTDGQRMSSVRDAADESAVVGAMLYQWGRKDPIPNGGSYYVNATEVDITTSYPLLEPADASGCTVAASILHPDKMVKNGTSSDWLGEDIELLWGDAKFSGNADNGAWTNVKTIYDPSPVGYRVAGYYTFTDLIAVDKSYYQLKGVMSMSDGVPTLATILNCVISTEMDGSTSRYLPKGLHKASIGKDWTGGKSMFGYGIYFKRNAADEAGNFYAQSGYRLGSNGSRQNYGVGSYHWLSCGNVTNTSDKATLNIGWFAWRTSAYSTGVDKGLPQGSAGVVGSINVQDHTAARNACAVRCVRE